MATTYIITDKLIPRCKENPCSICGGESITKVADIPQINREAIRGAGYGLQQYIDLIHGYEKIN